jgi:hypothetical protein
MRSFIDLLIIDILGHSHLALMIKAWLQIYTALFKNPIWGLEWHISPLSSFSPYLFLLPLSLSLPVLIRQQAASCSSMFVSPIFPS